MLKIDKVQFSELKHYEPVTWGCERITYTLEQAQWIAVMLAINGGAHWKVLDVMGDRNGGFPAKARLKTFDDARQWAYFIFKVDRVIQGSNEFTDEWDTEIRKAHFNRSITRKL